MSLQDVQPLAPPADAPPRDDLHCPLCEYDLRGLSEPRCPECGYRFEWADLTDPARRRHPYLFEHHPQRPVTSFIRTHLNAMRPARFWKSLVPAQPSYLRRLILYWLLTAWLLGAVILGHYALWVRAHRINTQFERARNTKMFPPGSPFWQDVERSAGGYQQFLDQAYPLPPSRQFYRGAWGAEGGWTAAFAVALLAWPWATFLALLVFRISMWRARIKPVRVLRCVLYSFDAHLWVALVLGAVIVRRAIRTWADPVQLRNLTAWFAPSPPIPRATPFNYRPDVVPDALLWLSVLAILWSSYRLRFAFRHYLRFDHPAATVFASQVMVLLAVVVAVINLLVTG